jgi:hypothetical protein
MHCRNRRHPDASFVLSVLSVRFVVALNEGCSSRKAKCPLDFGCRSLNPLPPRRFPPQENDRSIKPPAGPPQCVLATGRSGACPVCLNSQAPAQGFAKPASHFLIFSKTPPKHHQNATMHQPPHQPRREPVSRPPVLRPILCSFSERESLGEGGSFSCSSTGQCAPVRVTVRVRPSKSPMFTASSTGLRLQPPGRHPHSKTDNWSLITDHCSDRRPRPSTLGSRPLLPPFRPASALK